MTRFSSDEAQEKIKELQERSPAALDQRFEEGGVPTFEEIRGPTAGGWLAEHQQPWWAHLFVRLTLANPLARWTGKGFVIPFGEDRTGSGVNLFDNRVLPLRYQFRTYVRPARYDGDPCLALRYPFGSIMWGLVDDVRRIEEGVFLGRMVYRFPWEWKRRFIGYFVLCALSS